MRGHTLIIGFGNELAGDDAVGLLVVRELKRRLGATEASRVEVAEADGTYVALLDHVHNHRQVLIADAVVASGGAGDVRCMEIERQGLMPGVVSSHGVDASGIIGLLRAGGQPIERAALVGVVIEQPDEFTQEMSQPVREAVPRAVDAIMAWLERDPPWESQPADETAGEAPKNF